MKSSNVTADQKAAAAAQRQAHKDANWAFVIPASGGRGRMVKRGN